MELCCSLAAGGGTGAREPAEILSGRASFAASAVNSQRIVAIRGENPRFLRFRNSKFAVNLQQKFAANLQLPECSRGIATFLRLYACGHKSPTILIIAHLQYIVNIIIFWLGILFPQPAINFRLGWICVIPDLPGLGWPGFEFGHSLP